MGNNAFLVAAGLILLFLIWVYTGGPSRPISFAGPYLTPLASPTDESEAYGSTSWWGGKPEETAYGPIATDGKIRLGGGNVEATKVAEEYLTLSNIGDSPVNITGWRIVSERSGASATIPRGEKVPSYSDRADIVLEPGEEAIVTTGESPHRGSFAENICTGYFAQEEKFYPTLSQRCPDPLDELARYYSDSASRYDRCADYVQDLPTCTDPRSTSEIRNTCKDFVRERLYYGGCVEGNRKEPDFFTGTWRIYLNQSKQLWRSSGDSLVLIDATGTVVDRYSY
jgi:hypothetical protein